MTDPTKKVLSIRNVSKKFGNHTVVDKVSFDVFESDRIILCGPSGSGKSTLLRMINGLEKLNSGQIFYRDQEITRRNLGEIRKHIGMVFQQFNLFSNLSVLDNLIAAPIKVLGQSKQEMIEKANKYLKTLGIPDKSAAYPHELSGGQQQRVAIIRSLMMDPDIMLFDEPTSALDPEMIKEVLDVIRELSNQGMTMIIVTHEMGFAREIASKICFLEKGELIVEGTPSEFFDAQQNPRLRSFLSMILSH